MNKMTSDMKYVDSLFIWLWNVTCKKLSDSQTISCNAKYCELVKKPSYMSPIKSTVIFF